MLQKLLDSLEQENAEMVAACFEDDMSVEFRDYCPIFVGQPCKFLCGRNAVLLHFLDQFYDMNRFFTISDVQIEDDRNANFFSCYKGKYVMSRLTVEDLGDTGLIKKAVIRPL
ncbi:MAG: hypothetical protein HUJ65_07485 [Oscillospiraceae bacterium]|nr:hypothetical protein [Oscillospiraceae bacterium]